eukprot:3393143-Pleurochrysis_carterae.AAC.1
MRRTEFERLAILCCKGVRVCVPFAEAFCVAGRREGGSFVEGNVHSSVLVLRLYCGYTAVILRLYCGYTAVILRLYCGYTALILRLYCAYTAFILRLYCEAIAATGDAQPCELAGGRERKLEENWRRNGGELEENWRRNVREFEENFGKIGVGECT